ncbi:MAG TPA: MerR family transcriptional regulator [Ktedonobacterales bacterium]|nr:MerR family transcriptional regulator [Ktedonobacterales bacterium]
MMTHLHTSDLARAVGVHPNTVRRYVERGWLPPTPRGANGYRLFTQQHLDCLRVACLVHIAVYPGRAMRLSASKITQSAVADDWDAALEHARAHLAFVHAERAQAETAARLLERWATGVAADTTQRPLRIGQVASLLDISVDMLRNWERNGLLAIPRNEQNRYRAYGPADISRLRVIRMLGRVGYSQMAMLRMLLRLDRGETANLRHSLDMPAPDEDVYTAADRWLTTLAEQEAVAQRLLAVIEEILSARSSRQTSLV